MLELAPFHPIFVHFPVALLPVAFACDLAGRLTGRASLAHAGWWTLLFAAVSSPVTAATGWLWLLDFDDTSRHWAMTTHQWLGTALPPMLITLAAWRYRHHASAKPASWPLLASLAAAVILMLVQGHLGGTMTFGGVADGGVHSDAPHPSTTAASTPVAGDDADGWADSIRLTESER